MTQIFKESDCYLHKNSTFTYSVMKQRILTVHAPQHL